MNQDQETLTRAEAALTRYRTMDGESQDQNKDRLLEVFLVVLANGRQAPSPRDVRRVTNALDRIFRRPALAQALELAGDQVTTLLDRALLTAATRYLALTAQDPGYNNVIFGLIRPSAEARAARLDEDVRRCMLSVLLALPDRIYRDPMIRALYTAHRERSAEAAQALVAWRDQLPEAMNARLREALEGR